MCGFVWFFFSDFNRSTYGEGTGNILSESCRHVCPSHYRLFLSFLFLSAFVSKQHPCILHVTWWLFVKLQQLKNTWKLMRLSTDSWLVAFIFHLSLPVAETCEHFSNNIVSSWLDFHNKNMDAEKIHVDFPKSCLKSPHFVVDVALMEVFQQFCSV